MENLKKHLFSSSRPAGGIEPRSVFHIDNSDNLQKELQECFQSVEEFKNAAKNLDGAGTHLTECLTQALKVGPHQNIGEDCGLAFREVYASEQASILSQQLQEMSAALLNVKAKMEEASTEEVVAEYSQTLCRILLVFLKTQQTYHKFYSDKMAELAKRLNTSKGIPDDDVLSDKFMSMVLSKTPPREANMNNNCSPSQSPKGSPKLKQKNQDSQKTIKSSFLSFFERKPSPEEGKSAFYVEVGQNNNEPASVPNFRNSDVQNREQIKTSLERTASNSDIPQGNLLGLDLDAAGQGLGRIDNLGQSLPKLTFQGHDHLSSANIDNQGHPSSAMLQGHLLLGQGHFQNVPGKGSSLADFSGQADPLAAGSHTNFFTLGLDPNLPSTSGQMVDPWALSVNPGLPPSLKGMVQGPNGPLASEEELESVINLLSGGNSSNSPMQAIPENQVQGQVQLTVPQIYRMPSPASDSHVEEMKHPKYQMHRRSEGCLDLSGVRGNTWPHQHRASLPAVQPFPHRPMMDVPPRDMSMFMRRYSQEVHMPFRPHAGYMNQGQGQVQGQIMPGSQWSSYRGSGTWPSIQHHGGSDTVNSSWSGVQDSSDLSDDSSSGEQFYAVGRDLVQAIHSKDDSSEEESEKGRGGRDYKLAGAVGGYDPQEKSSMNTWPPKQQWSQSSLYLSTGVDQLEPPDYQFPHRPVQMQWSDPISSRSMWPAGPPPLGIPQQRNSHSMHGFGTLQ